VIKSACSFLEVAASTPCLVSFWVGEEDEPWLFCFLLPDGLQKELREEQTRVCQALSRPTGKRCHLFPATVTT